MQISYVVANSLILRQSADMPIREVIGANFVLAGLIGIAAACTIMILTSTTRSSSYFDLLLPAAVIIASSVMTSHSMEAMITAAGRDRKSTRLNSRHQIISYAVFC